MSNLKADIKATHSSFDEVKQFVTSELKDDLEDELGFEVKIAGVNYVDNDIFEIVVTPIGLGQKLTDEHYDDLDITTTGEITLHLHA